MPKPLLLPHTDKDVLARVSAIRLLELIDSTLAKKGQVHLSLTGGTMGIKIWEALGQLQENRANYIDWSLVHFWWSDERFVPSGHADRNEQQAKDAFLARAEIPAENLHIMGASDVYTSAEEAAQAYTEELARYAAPGDSSPLFDLTLLGMGPDGHIASLFPDREEILDERSQAIPVEDSPKPPPTRVSLTLPVIRFSDAVWFLIAGSDKAEATRRLLAAAELEEDQLSPAVLQETPAAGARGLQETLILATEDALA